MIQWIRVLIARLVRTLGLQRKIIFNYGRNKNGRDRYELNKQLAQMLKGGVIMDVTTPEQAKIAEAAGACAVMALERIPG